MFYRYCMHPGGRQSLAGKTECWSRQAREKAKALPKNASILSFLKPCGQSRFSHESDFKIFQKQTERGFKVQIVDMPVVALRFFASKRSFALP